VALREAVAAAQNVTVLLQAEVEEERLAAASDGHDTSPVARQGRGPSAPGRTPRLPHATIFPFTVQEEAGPAAIRRDNWW
jgi:hypothetical protein